MCKIFYGPSLIPERIWVYRTTMRFGWVIFADSYESAIYGFWDDGIARISVGIRHFSFVYLFFGRRLDLYRREGYT